MKKIINWIAQRIHWYKGPDIYIKGTWYGIHYNWQEIPLFDLIYHHRKMNTIHEYGVIVFGLWLYIKIDE